MKWQYYDPTLTNDMLYKMEYEMQYYDPALTNDMLCKMEYEMTVLQSHTN